MSGNDIMLIVSLLCAGSMLILLTISYKKSLTAKKEVEDTIFQGKTPKKRYKGTNKWLHVYTTFTKIPIFKGVVNKLYRQYIMIYPDDLKFVKSKTAKNASILALASLTVIVIACFANASMVSFVAIFVGIMIFGDSYIVNRLSSEEVSLLKEFNAFISEVRFHYMETEMIDEAVFDSIESCGKRVRPHAERIYAILVSDDMQDEAKKYAHVVNLSQIKTFLLVIITVMQYGDLKMASGSLFLNNLKNITKEINIEILLRDLKANAFKMLDVLCLVPIFAIEPLQNFSIGIIPELEAMYYGFEGFIITVVVFAVSLACHKAIDVFKEIDKPYVSEHPTLEKISEIKFVKGLLDSYESTRYNKMVKLEDNLKKVGESLTPRLFILHKMIIALVVFSLANLTILGVHESSKNRIVTSTVSVESSILTTSNDDLIAILQMIPWYTDYYKGNTLADEEGNPVSVPGDVFSLAGKNSLKTMSGARFDPEAIEVTDSVILSNKNLNVATLHEIMACDHMIKNSTTLDLAAKEVYNRIQQYHKEYYKWYELLGVLLISILAYMYPDIMMVISERSRQRKMEDEVIQFQTIIMMIAFFERTTIYTILEWMGEFAIIFKDSITKCLNKMNAGDEDALDELIEEENFPMFTMLIENLKMSDRVGVAQAFNTIDITRENFQDTREQSTKLRINSRKNIASLLVLFPTILTIVLVLAYPYMTESSRQLEETVSQIEM